MFRLLLAAAAAAFVSGAAAAADMPAPVAPIEEMAAPTMGYNWAGFYAGINAGWASATGNHTDTAGVTSGNYNVDGGLVGGTIGYNWQNGRFVYGLEADLAWSGIEGNKTAPCILPRGCYTDMDAFGTVRGRVGIAFDRVMPYLTAGAAFADMTVGQPGFSSTGWVSGWTAGGGVEVGITDKISFKAEALYADLGKLSYTVAIPVNATTKDLVIGRVGLNWHF